MRFSLAILSLVTSTLAATMRSGGQGLWNVTVTKYTYGEDMWAETVVAQFVSGAYPPPGIVTTCKHMSTSTTTEPAKEECDNPDFGYTYDGQTIKLQQQVELPAKMTVAGQEVLKLEAADMAGEVSVGNAIVDATTANA